MNPDRDSAAGIVHRGLRTRFSRRYAPPLPFIAAASSQTVLRASKDRACSASVQRAAKPPHWLPISRRHPCQGLEMRALQMRTLHLALRFTLIALASLLPYLREALAETLGDARVGFSAERVLIIDGQSYVGRMWHMPGEQRHEQDLPALRPVFILRAGSAVGDVILPALHTVVEFALPKEMSILGDPGLLRKPVGPETVNGIATTKYEVDEKTSQGRAIGLLWLSQDGIPMKCDARLATDKGRVSTVRWELRHVKIGTQDAALFEIPRDYAKLSPEAAAPLLGMRLARPPAR